MLYTCNVTVLFVYYSCATKFDFVLFDSLTPLRCINHSEKNYPSSIQPLKCMMGMPSLP